MAPTPKSLILDLLSSVKDGRALPVRALIAAAAVFGISENALRVALARLRAAGLVTSDATGSYRLGARAEAVNRQTTSWRTAERQVRPWNGDDWIAVFRGSAAQGAPGARSARARGERALAFLGFRELRPGLAVRPDNLVGGVAGVRERLFELGLEPGAEVVGLHALAPETARRAATLWDTASLRLAYRRTIVELERSERRLPTLPRDEAMRESFLLGGRAIRQIVFDPRLPDPLVPSEERRALVDTMLRYDLAGRKCWSSFMREMGAVPDATPAHLRFGGSGSPSGEARAEVP
ncbi:MAG TPA: PaaX family transcriptional regulator [Candidatus Binatia bacterium]